MHPHLNEQLASQHDKEVRALATRGPRPRCAQRAGAPLTPHAGRHQMRRRAGYALISLGLRLAYAAGED